MKLRESSLLKNHKILLGNKRDKRKKVVKSTSPTSDLKRATVKRQEGGTLFSIYNSIDPYVPSTFNIEVPELNTEIVTSPIRKKQEQVIEKAKESSPKKEELKKENEIEAPVEVQKQTPNISETWKSPYLDKNKWVEDLSAAYRNAGITNENAIKMLVSQDALESGWGRSAQGKFNFGNLTTGTNWKGNYTEGKDHDSEGNPIKQKFRAYNSMDEYAVDKVGFLKRLYDFDENDDINKFTAKLTGANKGKRRYAEAKNYATSLINVYNKYEDGGKMQKSEELLIKKALEFGQKTSEKMSPYDVRLIDFIKSKEGFRPKPERDKTDGKLTVGYGLTDPKLIRKYRNGITEEEASKHLIQHLQMGADSLATMPYYNNLNLGEKTALNDLIYNVGWNKFKNSKRLQSHLKADNDAGAKKEMNHGEHQARGLKIRRNQNRQMYDSTFNWKYKKGGVVKYQEPAQGIQKRDATYISPTYRSSPYKDVNYKPTSEIEFVSPKWTIQDGELVKTSPKIKSRVIPLEAASPEFDVLTGLKGISSLFANKAKPMILKPHAFKSELDWKNWSRGGAISKAHLDEYADIERTAKANGTWLKTEDGSVWKGDPRTWVQLMSKDGKKMKRGTFPSKNDVYYTGVDEDDIIYDDYNGTLWGSSSAAVARSYTNADDRVLTIGVPNTSKAVTVNAGGQKWTSVPFPNSDKRGTTNEVVKEIFDNGNDVAIIEKVKDAGSSSFINSRHGIYDSDELADDIIIKRNSPRKSLVGNNGDFDLTNLNLYKGILPLIMTYGQDNK